MNLGDENMHLLLKVVGGTVIVSVVGYVTWRRCRKAERLVNKPFIFLFNEIYQYTFIYSINDPVITIEGQK